MGTITSDTTSSSAVISYTTDDETWTVNPLVTIKSTNDFAVNNQNHANSILINNGNILSSTFSAVYFGGDGGQITNNGGHNIVGYEFGVEVNAVGTIVTNHGTILGLTSDGVFFGYHVLGPGTAAENITLNNDGQIYGLGAGVLMVQTGAPHAAGDTVHNSGQITSDHQGISIHLDSGLTATVTNAVGGVIKGPEFAINADSGRLSLDNSGTIAGQIQTTATERDSIVNRGKIIGEVHLGGGNDTFKAVGGGSAGKVFGEAGVDHLKGANASDQFDGGAGADVLTGGRGRDFLTGGADNDRFVFNSLADSVTGSKRDKILDFSHGEHDRIDLSTIDADTHKGGDQAFQFIGAQAFHSHGTTHVYGELRYSGHILQGDVNGDGKADFEIHINASSLAKGDFIL